MESRPLAPLAGVGRAHPDSDEDAAILLGKCGTVRYGEPYRRNGSPPSLALSALVTVPMAATKCHASVTGDVHPDMRVPSRVMDNGFSPQVL